MSKSDVQPAFRRRVLKTSTVPEEAVFLLWHCTIGRYRGLGFRVQGIGLGFRVWESTSKYNYNKKSDGALL